MKRTFKHFSKDKKCPICGTNDDKECFLIPIQGTEEGNLMQAEAFHLDCISLMYNKDEKVIYQVTKQ